MVQFFIYLFLSANIYLSSQNTEVYIGIEKNFSEEKIILASFTLSSGSQTTESLTQKLKEIIRTDLMFSRYFKVIETEDEIKTEENLNYLSKTARYSLTALIKAEESISIITTLYDNNLKEPILKKSYTSSLESLTRMAHIISDDIVEKITGKKGIAHSRITFSNDSTGYKEIYMIDYDGENLYQMTNHKSISIVPKWSSDGNKIFYTSYRYGNPDLFVIDMMEGKIKTFSRYQGLNIAGGFSPDGNEMALTLSRGKDPSIYIVNLVTKEVKKLLDNFGVCASPTYSPDGKEIAFVSDRPGNPQLYIYNLETKNYRKITNFYWVDSPNWSENGKWIVFSGRETKSERLNIFITDPTTSMIHRLTRNEGDNEDPSFSPDSRFIVFTSTRNKKRQIFVMDLDGSAPRLLSDKIKGNSYTPMWSR